jgi:hypothetical protein
MTKQEITVIVLKLLGVYAIIQAIPLLQYIWGLIGLINQDKAEISQRIWFCLAMGMPFLLMAVTAFLLIAKSERIAGLLFREDGPVSPTMSLSGQEIQAIIFSSVGVLVFLLSLPKLCQLVLNLWYMRSQYVKGQLPTDRLVENAWQAGIAVGIQCGFAVLLFVRAKGLAHLWHRIQGPRPAQTDAGGTVN